jgi:hypothetical protein
MRPRRAFYVQSFAPIDKSFHRFLLFDRAARTIASKEQPILDVEISTGSIVTRLPLPDGSELVLMSHLEPYHTA